VLSTVISCRTVLDQIVRSIPGTVWSSQPHRVKRLPRVLFACILVVAALAPAVTHAQETMRLTPEACVDLAMTSQPQLRLAGSRVEAAEASRGEMQSWRWPTVRAGASYRRLSSNVTTFILEDAGLGDGLLPDDLRFDTSLPDQYALRGEVEQRLFSGGETRHSVDAATQATRAEEHRRQSVAQDVAQAVVRAYWTLVAAEAKQEVTAVAKRQVAEQLRVTRVRFREGMALRSDVLALEARAAEINADRRNADAAVASARRHLADRIGIDPAIVIEPATRRIPYSPLRHTTEELFTRAIAMRPDLAADGRSVAAWRHRSRAAEGARWPQVSFIASYVYARPNMTMFPLEDRFQGTWELGVQMSVDLWDWNRRGYRAQQVEASWQEAMERRQMTRQAIRLEVADARDEVERAADVLVASREREEAMEEVFRVVRRRHAAGEALTVEVLSTEHEFRRARVAVVEAEARYAQAHAGLDRAVGRMRAGVQP